MELLEDCEAEEMRGMSYYRYLMYLDMGTRDWFSFLKIDFLQLSSILTYALPPTSCTDRQGPVPKQVGLRNCHVGHKPKAGE